MTFIIQQLSRPGDAAMPRSTDAYYPAEDGMRLDGAFGAHLTSEVPGGTLLRIGDALSVSIVAALCSRLLERRTVQSVGVSAIADYGTSAWMKECPDARFALIAHDPAAAAVTVTEPLGAGAVVEERETHAPEVTENTVPEGADWPCCRTIRSAAV